MIMNVHLNCLPLNTAYGQSFMSFFYFSEQTKDVDVTITNILEGRVQYSTEEYAAPLQSSPCVPDKVSL